MTLLWTWLWNQRPEPKVVGLPQPLGYAQSIAAQVCLFGVLRRWMHLHRGERRSRSFLKPTMTMGMEMMTGHVFSRETKVVSVAA
jgi:hypothetical protein